MIYKSPMESLWAPDNFVQFIAERAVKQRFQAVRVAAAVYNGRQKRQFESSLSFIRDASRKAGF
jgi:hypothetical protein